MTKEPVGFNTKSILLNTSLATIYQIMTYRRTAIDQHLLYLADRVTILEGENVETTNALYEIENRLQSQIDILINHILSLKHLETNDVY
jgi:hypothetical protein